MKTSRKLRRAIFASLLTGTLSIASTGCSSTGGFSLSSMNPFTQSQGTSFADKSTRPDQSVASKTKNAIAGAFSRGKSKSNEVVNEVKSEVDPLRLDSKTDVGPEVFVANGRLWETSGNSQKAMESYTRALKVRPNDPAALAAIARLQFSQGNHAKAIDFFQQAIQQKPDDAGLHNDLGLTHSKIGNKAAASAALSRALELSPGTSRYANNLASVKFDQGDTEGAFKVLASNNEPAVAHFNIAFLYEQQGQLDKSRVHLQKVLEFEQAGKTDSSVARAVSRSKDMLAKMGVPASPPQSAIVRAGKGSESKSSPQIRQTSQSMTSDRIVRVKPAVVQMQKKDDAGQRKIPAQFATARLGTKTVAPQKPKADPIPISKPASTPAVSKETFSLPDGFSLPSI